MKSISSPFLGREEFKDILSIMRNSPWAEDLEDQILNLWELCIEKDERELLKELINKFFILDKKEERKACDGINNYINSLPIKAVSAFIVSVADVGKNDGSLVGLQLLEQKIKPLNEWEDRYVSHIPDLINRLEKINTIFIFDDFIGSGTKIVAKYGWLSNLLTGKGLNINDFDIHILSFSAMDFGIKYIEQTLGINIYSHNILSKAITAQGGSANSTKKINVMLTIEEKLANKYKNRNILKYSLGYKKSESLYYWESYSCPNNVFPIFWWPMLKGNKQHKTLFVRTN